MAYGISAEQLLDNMREQTVQYGTEYYLKQVEFDEKMENVHK